MDSLRSKDRRAFFLKSLGLLGVAGSASLLGKVCSTTLPDQKGPYYPESSIDKDNDLTRITEKDPGAQGQVILITGVVQDIQCEPITGAYVDIWQANKFGKYNHSKDGSPLPFDEAFQYWGRAKTDNQGRYSFRTIIPGHYPTGGGMFRPPHVHFMVSASGFKKLTTQMYFNPATYSDSNLAKLVATLNEAESVPEGLKVLFKAEPGLPGEGLIGNFPITLKKG